MVRILGFWYRNLQIFANDLAALAALPLDTSRKFEFAWIDDEAGVKLVAKVAAREGFPRRIRVMRRNLAEGGRIAVALESGEPVAWQLFRPQEQAAFFWVNLRAHDAVFVSGSYTVRAWRGQRLMTQLSRFAAATYAGQRFRRMCSIVDSNNTKSLRGHIYRGDEQVGWIRSLRFAHGPTLVASDARVACGFFNPSHRFVYTVRG